MSSEGTGYTGLVLSYQRPGHMYLVMWTREYTTRMDSGCGQWCSSQHAHGSIPGLQIRRVHITDEEEEDIKDKLWGATDSSVSTVLWQDPNRTKWSSGKSYRIFVSHRPSIGLLRLRVYDYAGEIIVDSGAVYDIHYLGGNVGIFTFANPDSRWANTRVSCQSPEQYGLHIEETSLTLGSISLLQLTRSFLLSAWIRPSESGLMQPVLCSQSICLYLDESLTVRARVGHVTHAFSTPITADTWTHVALKFDIQNYLLTIFKDSTKESIALTDVQALIDSSFYLGTDTDNFFLGDIADVRVVSALVSGETETLVLTSTDLARQRKEGLVVLHLTFQGDNYGETSSIQIEPSENAPTTIPISLIGLQHKLLEELTAAHTQSSTPSIGTKRKREVGPRLSTVRQENVNNGRSIRNERFAFGSRRVRSLRSRKLRYSEEL